MLADSIPRRRSAARAVLEVGGLAVVAPPLGATISGGALAVSAPAPATAAAAAPAARARALAGFAGIALARPGWPRAAIIVGVGGGPRLVAAHRLDAFTALLARRTTGLVIRAGAVIRSISARGRSRLPRGRSLIAAGHPEVGG